MLALSPLELVCSELYFLLLPCVMSEESCFQRIHRKGLFELVRGPISNTECLLAGESRLAALCGVRVLGLQRLAQNQTQGFLRALRFVHNKLEQD